MTDKAKLILTVILSAGTFLSCSKDDKYLSFSDFQTFSILETLTTDDYREQIQKTEALAFINGQLQTGTVTQVIPYYDNYTTICQNDISYANTNVIVKGCVGDLAIYTLNKEGFAISCDIEDSGLLRHYNFSYKDGYLSSVSETINNTPTFQMELLYNEGCLIKTIEERYDSEYTINFIPTTEKNVGKLPLHYLTEIYPLSFHRMAIYAGILGKAPRRLIQQITSENNISDTVNYSYKFNNEYIINCRIEIKGDGWSSYRSLQFYYE